MLLLAPVALVLWLALAVTDLCATFAGRVDAPSDNVPNDDTPPRDLTDSNVSVVIPSWNGRDLLARLLPSLRAELERCGGDHEVLVVDNGSDDGTAELLEHDHPWVTRVALSENRFFGGGVTAGVERATRDVIVLLNNDMVVEPGFLTALLAGFAQPNTFAVAALIEFDDQQREESGKTRSEFHRGTFRMWHEPTSAGDARVDGAPVLWAGGGSSAFDRRKYEALHGLDPIYDPFYLEDLDLSYRAWKHGWDVRFTALSRVRHLHRGTVRRFAEDFVARVLCRNRYLFFWANITDVRATLSHCLWLPSNAVLRARLRTGPGRHAMLDEAIGLAFALGRLPTVLRRRWRMRRTQQRTDREVWQLANRAFRPAPPRLAAPGELPRLRILVLAARLPRLDTDGSWILFNLLRELSARHDITLFAFIDRIDEAAQAEPLRAFCREVHTHVRSPSDEFLNAHHLVPRRLARDYSAGHMREAIRRVLASTDFDLVQVEYAEMAHLVRGELVGVPSVHTAHEPISMFCRRRFEQARGWGQRLRRRFEWGQALEYEVRLLRQFSHIVTLSSVDERELRIHAPELPVTTIPSGIDLARFPPAPAEEEQPIVTFVGYFMHPPNVDGALWLAREIFPQVLAEVPQARLRIVGRDPSEEVRALAQLPSTEVTGFVPELAPYLRESSVMAVPIRLGSGLRGKILEAWSAAKAVVTTTRGADGLPVANGVHALVADEGATFAAALVRLLRDREFCRSLGNAGRELVVEQFTAAAAARRYERLYLSLLDPLERKCGAAAKEQSRAGAC